MKILFHVALEITAVVLTLLLAGSSVQAQEFHDGGQRLELVMARFPDTAYAIMTSSGAVESASGPASADSTCVDQNASADQAASFPSLVRLNSTAGLFDQSKPLPRESHASLLNLNQAPPAAKSMSKSEFIGFLLTRAGTLLPPFRAAAAMYNYYHNVTQGESYKFNFDCNPAKDRYRMKITIALP